MFGIGLPELIVILGLALIVVGPDKLPELARSIAKGVMELKKTAEGLKDELTQEGGMLEDLRPDIDAVKTLKKELAESAHIDWQSHTPLDTPYTVTDASDTEQKATETEETKIQQPLVAEDEPQDEIKDLAEEEKQPSAMNDEKQAEDAGKKP
jgi:sec-independent protein translocase protein TatB